MTTPYEGKRDPRLDTAEWCRQEAARNARMQGDRNHRLTAAADRLDVLEEIIFLYVDEVDVGDSMLNRDEHLKIVEEIKEKNDGKKS